MRTFAQIFLRQSTLCILKFLIEQNSYRLFHGGKVMRWLEDYRELSKINRALKIASLENMEYDRKVKKRSRGQCSRIYGIV